MNQQVAKFSRIGFVLSATGAAVGLGNIWKFPYITGVYGGGAFVLVYLVTILLIGASLLIAEMVIGKRGQKDCVSSFEEVAPKGKKGWKYAGFMLFTGLVIMTFYSVVIGWIFYYMYLSFSGLPTTIDDAKKIFDTLYAHAPFLQILFHVLSVLFVGGVLLGGIKKGIEKTNLILIPFLLFILLGLLVYAMNFDGFTQAVAFMFAPDFSKLDSEAIIRAVGHSFFTLSIGIGSIMTYAAVLPKHSNIYQAGMMVAFMDTLIALIAGLVIFSFLFQFGGTPDKGPGLVFVSLPVIFAKLGAVGSVIALIFFLAMAVAGLTSAISLVEPSVMYLEDRLKWGRKKAVVWSSLLYFAIGVLVIFSISDGYREFLTFGKKSLFDLLEFSVDSFLMPLGGVLIALFVGYVMNRDIVEGELLGHMGNTVFKIWYFSIRYIAPIAVLFLAYNALKV